MMNLITYGIKLSDKGQYGDITQHLNKILEKCCDNTDEIRIEFEKGEYHFYEEYCKKETIYASNTDSHKFPEKNIAINIHRIKNLTFDGCGSEFIMHGKVVPFKVTESENIVIKNLSWDFPSPTVLEMTVKSKSKFSAEYTLPKNMMWDIKNSKLHWYDKSPFTNKIYWEEYNNGESYCNVIYDEQNNSICRHNLNVSPFNMAVKLKRTSQNTVKINYIKPLSDLYKLTNSFQMCPSKKRDCVGSFFCDSKNILVENVQVHYMPGFGWLVQMCENVSFISCDFMPDKNSDRMCTSFADLIHVSGAKGKIHIEKCNFSHAHDDAINIHGTYTRIKKMLNNKTLLLEYVHHQQNGFVQYHPDDKVVFYCRKNFSVVDDEKEFTVKSVTNPLCCGNNVKEMVVEFYEDLPTVLSDSLQYVCENITYTPEVYIGSCSFDTIPTRGILCTTRKEVIIENNTFDRLTMAIIYLSNDCNDWYESGPIHNMTIRGNKFYVRKSSVFKGKKGAILIEPIVAQSVSEEVFVHSNITIENNVFYMEHDNVINAENTKNIAIKNNEIYTLGDENTEAFVFEKCKNITTENNLFK